MCKEPFAKAIDRSVFPGVQGGPHDHINAAKAIAFYEALQPDFKLYAAQTIKNAMYAAQTIKNAKALATAMQKRGYRIVSRGTDNHLLLVDVFGSKGITGKEAEHVLETVNISINKNMIPFDPRKPLDPSGIRLGTPAVTPRGMRIKDMEIIAGFIDEALQEKANEESLNKIKRQVTEFALQFPVPGTD